MPYSADLARAVLGNLQAQLRSDDFYDVIVHVHAAEFRCHRLILCACSKYISDQLQSPGSDSVVLTNVSADSFKHVLECIYGAEDVLTDENVSDLWRTAHRLKVEFLFEACEEFILARVSKENCVEIFNLAKSLSSPKVYEEAWNEIVENFQYVYARGEFVKLDFEAMFSLVSDENISVSSEDSVIAAVSKWIEHSPEITDPEIDNGYGNDERNTGMMSEQGTDLTTNDRTNFVLELLSSCRLFVVSGNCIQTLAKTKWVTKNKKAFTLVRAALKYLLQPEMRGFYCPLQAVHRNRSRLQNVIAGNYRHSNGSQIFACRALDGTWYRLCDKSLGNHVAAYDTDLYFVSSKPRHGGNGLSVRKYNSLNGVVQDMPSLTSIGSHCLLICLDHYIYAVEVGVSGMVCRLNLLEETQGKWEKAGKLFAAVQNAALMICGSSIVVLGNEAGTQEITIQSFDTLTNVCNIYTKKLPSASSFVTFQLDRHSYVLLSNGKVWRLNSCSKEINMTSRGALFEEELLLQSAVTFKDELFLSASQKPRQLKTDCIEHLSCVNIVERPASCLLNTVIPVRMLIKKDH